MIEIFTIIYNEEIILQKFINHYRERFPNCEITIYDNMSTDNSRQIAIKNGCKIIDYDSNNQIRDDLYLEIKNNCWKNANTDWVLIVDTDEFIYINEEQLKNEESLGKTIISFEGWNLITMSNNPDIIDLNLKWGSRAVQYDKSYLFNKKLIKGNVISLEVGEHIPAEFMDIYLDNITNNCDNYLITSWAVRGQEGFGHVNCLDNHEIIPKIEKRGFTYLKEESESARNVIKDNTWWFKNTILIFKKNEQ